MSTDAIRAAIVAAFPPAAGPSGPSGDSLVLTPLPGGRSGASVFSFAAEGRQWVVRHSPFQGTERLRVAATLEVGPALRYVDLKEQIAIMELFEGLPLRAAREPASRKRIAETLRRLHEGPEFPPTIGTSDFYRSVATGYAERVGEALPAALTELLEQCIAKSAGAALAPCHRDLNPGNILVGADRVCFLDWDSAGAGDPFLDLAQLCVFYAPTPDLRAEMLAYYLAREPTAAERARFHEAHVYALTAYALAFAHIAGRALRAQALPLAEAFQLLATQGHGADPEVVSVSLLEAAVSCAKAGPSF